jgi:hypothetical protein
MQSFAYDRAFGSDSTQKEVFEFVAAPLIKGDLPFTHARMLTCLEISLHFALT